MIHRDIKPSNMLVTIRDDDAVPKIIDFGIAKATSQRLTERTVFTELGQWIGTPEYMSPEQAEMTGLDIDTRTDVYSLGVVLYELLVGAQPFDSTTLRSAGFDEMRRRIREEEPPRPSTRLTRGDRSSDVAAERRRTSATNLARELKGDLDWIVMKALEKDRTRRYATPMELAADVQRHMDHEPVEASPPSTVYRLGKFVRRNRVAVATASLVMAVLILGTIGTALGMVRAKREAQASRQVVQLMSGILGGLNPTGAYGHTESIDEILDRGLAQIDETLEGQPLVAAHLKDLIGRVYMGLGEFFKARPVLEEARDMFQRALEIRENALGVDHPDLVWLLPHYAHLLRDLGEEPAARRMFERNLAIAEKRYGSQHMETAGALAGLAYHEYAVGNARVAHELMERSLEIQIRVVGAKARRLGITYYNLACINAIEGNPGEALANLHLALDTGWSWRGVETDSDLDSLRGDPEFEAIMDEIKRRIEAGE